MTAGRRALVLVPVVLLLMLGWDLGGPPEGQWATRALVGGVRVYQRTASAWMPSLGVRCRFEPTCSHYAIGALERHGAFGGGLRAAWRILRCGPWTPLGSVDPP